MGQIREHLAADLFGVFQPSHTTPGDVWIDSGTHVHANWAFSAPGTYTATVTFLGTTTRKETQAMGPNRAVGRSSCRGSCKRSRIRASRLFICALSVGEFSDATSAR